MTSRLSIWCLKCERATISGTRFCTRHSAKLPDYQKDEQLSTYKFSIGDRVTARYTNGEAVTGTVKGVREGLKYLAYSITPDTKEYGQMFYEHELTKLSEEPAESSYTKVIADIDAEIQKQEALHTKARKRISDLLLARQTLTDLQKV